MNFNTTFPRFSKIDVNGKGAHPLFTWLKGQVPEDEGNKEAKSFEKKIKLLKPMANEISQC